MKKQLAVLGLMLSLAGNALAYTFTDFVEDLKKDTAATAGKQILTSYFYDALDEGDARSKVGVSIPILAYKFVSINPAFVYTPDAANRRGEVALTFPIQLGKIPLPFPYENMKNFWLPEGDPAMSTNDWIDHFFIGPYFSHNFVTGKFGAGLNTGIRF